MMTTLSFVHPSTHLIAGPTGSGKTKYVNRVILENMIEPLPSRIVWIYSEWQDNYRILKDSKPNIEFFTSIDEGLYETFDSKITNLLVIDDKMSSKNDSHQILHYFTEGSHHRNLTIMYIVQNLFDKGKEHRTVSLNSQYITLFRNPRDRLQISILARQMYPGNQKFMTDSYYDATKEPYGYLLVDLRPETPDDFRLRSKIFPNELTDVYIKK